MKKTLLMLLVALSCAFSAVADEESFELNCDVDVNSDKVTNGSKDVFAEFKQAVSDYMNVDHKWTNATFGINERIYCKLLFTISSWDDATGVMQGDLQIQSQRPVYNSTYTTAIINFRDTKVKFTYERNMPLVFSEEEMKDNLTAILNFWAYMIIAMTLTHLNSMAETRTMNRRPKSCAWHKALARAAGKPLRTTITAAPC